MAFKKFGSFLCGMVLVGLSTGSAMQVAPSYQIFDVKPGEQVMGECQVLNNEDEVVTVKVYSKDWFVLPENKDVLAKDWLVVNEPEFQLQKGETRKIPFQVKVPTNTVGELVGMISMEFTGEVETMLKQVVSVAVYAAATGTENLKADLQAISVMPSTTSMQVGVQIKNVGNVHVRPTGEFWIYDQKSKPLTRIMIQQGRPTYPGREGSYFGQLHNFKLKKGKYRAKIELQDVDRHKQILSVSRNFILDKDNKVQLVK